MERLNAQAIVAVLNLNKQISIDFLENSVLNTSKVRESIIAKVRSSKFIP